MYSGIRTGLMAAVVGIAAVAAAPGAQAAQMRYEVFWGGFHTADVTFSNDNSPGAYHAVMGVATTGMAERLSGLSLQVQAWGKALRGALTPDRFSADTMRKDGESKLAVQFAPGTQPAQIVLDQSTLLSASDDDKDPPPPVPPEQRVGTMDPLSALIEAGRRAAGALNGGARGFTLPVYDGRHRYDVKVVVDGPSSTEIDGRDVPGVSLQLTFAPVAGFKDSTREMWDNARFSALIDPATGLPIRIVSKDFKIATVISAEMPQAAQIPAQN